MTGDYSGSRSSWRPPASICTARCRLTFVRPSCPRCRKAASTIRDDYPVCA